MQYYLKPMMHEEPSELCEENSNMGKLRLQKRNNATRICLFSSLRFEERKVRSDFLLQYIFKGATDVLSWRHRWP